MSRGGSKGRGRALLPPSVAASLNSGGHFGGVKKASIFPGSGNNNSGILGISVPPPLFPNISESEFPIPLDKQQPLNDQQTSSSNANDEILNEWESMMDFYSTSFRILPPTKSTDVARYSDKYLKENLLSQLNQKQDVFNRTLTDINLFPDEISKYIKKTRKKTVSCNSVSTQGNNTTKAILNGIFDEFQSKDLLETEQKQQQHQEEEDEAEEDEIVYEDDLLEDEGDYNASYFDPGDEYNDGDDGGDEPYF